MSTWDIVLGGAITLAGTLVTQGAGFMVAKGQRVETRRVVANQFRREALDKLQDAAKSYRVALVGYNDELEATGSTSTVTEAGLRAARMDFQALVHRVDDEVSLRLTTWEKSAVDWSQGAGSAALEEARWTEAMVRCGSSLKATLS